MRRFHKYAGSTTAKRVMCVGDSMTKGGHDDNTYGAQGGYRQRLWNLLTERRQVQFIGTQGGNDGIGPEKHMGFPGAGIGNFTGHNWAADFASVGTPHILLLLLGVNGFQSSLYMSDVVTPIMAAAPACKVVCAPLVFYIDTPNDVSRTNFNTAIQAAVQGDTAYGTTLFWASGMATACTRDTADYSSSQNFHPSDIGYNKMADVWYTFVDQNRLLA